MAINDMAASPKRTTPRWRTWLIALACVVVFAWPATVFCGQYRQFFVMRAENERLKHEILGLKAEQQRLRKEQAILQTTPGMEREARRLGYLRPGEARLSVPE
jgi:hypothetical protein